MKNDPATRPNILMIITDQHRADHVGFGGNKIVRTPNLDRIAARGMVFRQGYVANPICMPNRASILTGVVPSAHGVRYNGVALDPSFDTFVRQFREAGYRTALVGKSHLQNMNDAPEIIAKVFPDSPARDLWRANHPQGWDRYEMQDRHRAQHVDLPPDFYGFDDVTLTVNHSDYCSGHYYQWLLDQGADPAALQGLAAAQPYEGNWAQVWKTAVPEALYPTRFIAQQTIARLGQFAAADEPFLLQCSFPDPHHPFTPPGRYFDMYDPAQIPCPPPSSKTTAVLPRRFSACSPSADASAFACRRSRHRPTSTATWQPRSTA
ncbi:MAG: sulfatase-like hydrolase/transferase [Burkholderiaceae bacterium]